LFKRNDWLFGLISLALGASTLYFTADLAKLASMDPAGPAALPMIIAWIMIAIGAVHVGGSWLVIRKDPDPAPAKKNGNISRVIAVCAACFVYYLALDWVGYPIMTPLLMIAIMGSVGVRSLKKMLGMSIGTTAVLFCVFYFLLKVSLPLGMLQMFFE
jgi:hypothetical protein